MSVLDLLTGALGAFCFLTLALFPSYFKAQSAAAQNSQAPSTAAAPDTSGLSAANQMLKSEIASAKHAAERIPSFAMWDLGSYDSTNHNCGQFKIVRVEGPTGRTDLGIYPTTETAPGVYQEVFLMAIQPGAYRLVLNASGPGCILGVSELRPNAPAGQSWNLSATSRQYTLPFTVTPDQINSNFGDHG
ncbi:MAG TPA: hypothetical protein VNE82_23505 [Candidatus Binataceae bacterium]|nr:hypothetical protein [Candidatus Binataceae bacterium]